MNETDNIFKIVKEYHKAIIDMRQKVENKELILCFGAGVSKPWGIPNWNELVEKIAKNKKVNGEIISKSSMSLTSKIQALFEKFKKEQQETYGNSEDLLLEDHIRFKWIEIIRYELYGEHKSGDLQHPYLNEFIKIIEESPVTINYNFDNLTEQLIHLNQNGKKWGNNYEIVDRPSVNFKKSTGVIIHPNGCISESPAESSSEHLIFSEKSFQDQLIESIMGYYNPILYFFSRYTTLFIGLSMTDPTLRHLLRQNAVINPGHFHYYIYFKDDNFCLTEKDMKSIQESYFDTYNLIVLFMDNSDLQSLGKCLNINKWNFEELINDTEQDTVCNYYITGAPGTGKTSVLDIIKSFKVYTEFDEANELLYKEELQLSDKEKDDLDSWIAKQFRLRNRILDQTSFGIQLIDRSPLDPITYASDTKEKALDLNKVYKKTKRDLNLVSGHVILFTADIDIVYKRLNKRNPSTYSKEWCEKKLNKFKRLFEKQEISIIDTSNKSITEIAREIIHLIYFDKYKPVDLNKYMRDYCEGKRKL